MTAKDPGHLENLSDEQQQALRQMWAQLFDALEKASAHNSETSTQEIAEDAKLEAAEAKAPKSLIASVFRSRRNDDSSRSGTSGRSKSTTRKADEVDSFPVPKATLLEELFLLVAYDNPDAMVLRFLRARKWDVDAAIAMLMQCIRWRIEFGVRSIMEGGESLVSVTELSAGKGYFRGYDMKDRPCVFVRPRLHMKDDCDLAALEKFVVLTIESGRNMLKYPVETICLVFDMTDFGLRNMDYKLAKFMTSCLEAYYPESLGVALIVNAPWIFNGCWTIIQPWLDPVVASKIHFVKAAELADYIPLSNLPADLDGQDDYVFAYVPASESELKTVQELRADTSTKALRHQEWMMDIHAFMKITQEWSASTQEDTVKSLSVERSLASERVRMTFTALVPFIRSKTYLHRTGTVHEAGITY
ncbi:CRAL-TRIO domain-containing protein [Polychytrium aggregatum]|uniref:CRAL-TRIO domain-containing protein n=1 Tax=Polychytrium aggregatum TaxID=110093 RepID=UPI0022FEB5A4|nr:CRAL-TRIO domain-containing protein [Polychytrium aggregatum]KAI9208295.1 CRAL-TRIO domain-containing protein [Polychytrium aggregatum]